MDNRAYWIWLSLCFSYGSGKPQQLAESEDIVSIYENRETICESVDYLTPRDGDKLRKISCMKCRAFLSRSHFDQMNLYASFSTLPGRFTTG